jgi:hypothetical protein
MTRHESLGLYASPKQGQLRHATLAGFATVTFERAQT